MDKEYKTYIKNASDKAKKAAMSVAGIDAVRGENLIYFIDNLSSILKQGYLVSLDCLVFDCGLFREK